MDSYNLKNKLTNGGGVNYFTLSGLAYSLRASFCSIHHKAYAIIWRVLFSFLPIQFNNPMLTN